MKDALAIHRMLLARETLHEIVRLPRAIANADELPAVLGVPANRCLATRVFAVQPQPRQGLGRGSRHLVAVLVTAGSALTSDTVRTALAARSARPASADMINRATDYTAGLVAPLLLPDAMPLFADAAPVAEIPPDEVVYTAAGEPYVALGIRAQDLFTISGAKPLDLRVAARIRTPGVRRR